MFNSMYIICIWIIVFKIDFIVTNFTWIVNKFSQILCGTKWLIPIPFIPPSFYDNNLNNKSQNNKKLFCKIPQFMENIDQQREQYEIQLYLHMTLCKKLNF